MDDFQSNMTGIIQSNREMIRDHFRMVLALPASFPAPLPGQFIMLHLRDRSDVLLGRPFSVSGFERQPQQARLEILYRSAGRGTQLLSCLRKGDGVDLSVPLGHPFEIPLGTRHIVIVAGGIGVAPMRFLISEIKKKKTKAPLMVDFFIGAKTADALLDREEIRLLCEDTHVCTDDNSFGFHGSVTDALEERLESYAPQATVILACGPLAMIRHLAEILKDTPIPCQASLEARMACGIGACLGCAVAVYGKNGETTYQRVCKEGPVFDLRKLKWE